MEIHVKKVQLAAHHLKKLMDKQGDRAYAHTLLESIVHEVHACVHLIRSHTAPPRFAVRSTHPLPDMFFEVRERSITDLLDALRQIPQIFAKPHATWEDNANAFYHLAELFENLSMQLVCARKTLSKVRPPENASTPGNEYFLGFLVGPTLASNDLRPLRLYELVFHRSMKSPAYPSLSFCTERLFIWITKEVSFYRSKVANYCCSLHCPDQAFLDPKFHFAQRYFQAITMLLRLYPVSSSRRPREYKDRLRPLQEWQSYIYGMKEFNTAMALEAQYKCPETIDTLVECCKRALQYFTASRIGAMHLRVLAHLGKLYFLCRDRATANRYLTHVLNKISSHGTKYMNCSWAVEAKQNLHKLESTSEIRKTMLGGFAEWMKELENLQNEASNIPQPDARKDNDPIEEKRTSSKPENGSESPSESQQSESEPEHEDRGRGETPTAAEINVADTEPTLRLIDDSQLLILLTLGREVSSMPSFMLFLRHLNAHLPPLNPASRTRLAALAASHTVSKSAFRSILFTYHPDKNGTYGPKWKSICLEITKVCAILMVC